MGPADFDDEDPEVVQQWVDEQRESVLRYFRDEGISHGGVAEEPDYCVAPHATIWRVFNVKNRNSVGFWAIAGDLPTDYMSSNDAQDVREVMAYFGKTWKEVAECMRQGKKHPTITIGTPEVWPELAPLLEHRADVLLRLAEDDDAWEEEEIEIEEG